MEHIWDQLQYNEFNLCLGMAMMHQAEIAIREFSQEFEWRAWDAGMAEEDAKVHLVSVLIQDTLTHLDAYVTMHGGDKMAYLETIQDQLCHVPYVQMLAYLK